LSNGAADPSSKALASKVVTGAATGIGKGITARLAGGGAAVVVNHLQPQVAEAEAVVAGIREKGGCHRNRGAADISRREQFAALFDQAEEASTQSTSSSTTPPSPRSRRSSTRLTSRAKPSSR
jgi:NAD(P)-dependent dehydrogenase (short-subunit alcohol dehydrogenase family)